MLLLRVRPSVFTALLRLSVWAARPSVRLFFSSTTSSGASRRVSLSLCPLPELSPSLSRFLGFFRFRGRQRHSAIPSRGIYTFLTLSDCPTPFALLALEIHLISRSPTSPSSVPLSVVPFRPLLLLLRARSASTSWSLRLVIMYSFIARTITPGSSSDTSKKDLSRVAKRLKTRYPSFSSST